MRESSEIHPLRLLRAALGLTQQQVARQVNCSHSMISLIESYRKYPSMELAHRISRLVGAPINWLFPLLQDPKELRSA